VDREVPLFLRMFEKRLRGYRAIGYERDEAALAYAAEPTEPTGDLVAAEASEVGDQARRPRVSPAGSARRRPSVRAFTRDADAPSRKRAAGRRATRD